VQFIDYINGFQHLILDGGTNNIPNYIKTGTFISQKSNGGVIINTARIVRTESVQPHDPKKLKVFIIYTKQQGSGFTNGKVVIGDTTKRFDLKETDILVTNPTIVSAITPSTLMEKEKVCYELKENIGNYILTKTSGIFPPAVTKGKHIKDPSNDKILGVIIQRISNTQIRVMLLKPNLNSIFNSFISSVIPSININTGIKIGTANYQIKKIENSPTIDLTGGKFKPPSRPAGQGSAPEFGACINTEKPLVAASQKDDACYKVNYQTATTHADAKTKCAAVAGGKCKYMEDYFKLGETHNFIGSSGVDRLSSIPATLGNPPKYSFDNQKRFTNNKLLRFDYVPETPDGSYPTDKHNLKISGASSAGSPVLKVRGGIHKCQPHIGCNTSRPECSSYIDYIDALDVTQAKNNFKNGKATCLPNMDVKGITPSEARTCLNINETSCKSNSNCKWISDKHKRRELLGFMKRRFNKCQQTHPGYNFTLDDKNLNQSIGAHLQTFR
jgi:hypothetical protein